MKQHAESGYQILKGIAFPWPVARIVRQHHERLDGSGYPLGLRGDDILTEARILSIADVVEAMASDRPYRSALGVDAALEEVTLHRGRLFEPRCRGCVPAGVRTRRLPVLRVRWSAARERRRSDGESEAGRRLGMPWGSCCRASAEALGRADEGKVEPGRGLEPRTPSLPWRCSAD